MAIWLEPCPARASLVRLSLTGAKSAIAFLQQIHGQIELSPAAVDLNRNQIEFLAQTKAGLPEAAVCYFVMERNGE